MFKFYISKYFNFIILFEKNSNKIFTNIIKRLKQIFHKTLKIRGT